MALPAQVRKQSEEVQELYRQLNPDAASAPGEDGADGAGEGQPEEDFSDGQADGIDPAPTGEQPDDGSDNEDENSETYAQRWRSLQGTYNATVRKLSDAETRISQLEELFATISTQPQQTQNPDPEPSAPVSLLTDDERSEYGESIDIMRKVSQEVVAPLIARLDSIENLARNLQTTVVPQVKAVSQRQQMTAEQSFWSELTSLVPNWREVNENPAFHDWLLEVDPLTGTNRQAFLEDAQQNLDAGRVSAFFRSWQQATGNAPTAQPQQQPANELAKQVSPGRTRGGGTPQSKQAKTYTPDDIKKFYADVAAGRYKGRDQERARIERDIFAAQSEGRIAAQT